MPRDEAPASRGFRRRIPLELTAEELQLLEEAEARFGTKRATLVAGLQALTRLDGIERELAETHAACEAASARATALEETGAKLGAALTKAQNDATQARKGKQSVERADKSAREQADAQAEDLLRLLGEEQEACRRLEEELADLEETLFEALRCPRCGALVEPSDWKTKAEGDRVWVYHGSCGFRRGGLLETTSVFGYRARP